MATSHRVLLLSALLTTALGAAPESKKKKRLLQAALKRGDRTSITNVISYEVETTVTVGEKSETTVEGIQRTERFVDRVMNVDTASGFEIERTFLKLFTKLRSPGQKQATVVRSPLTGRTVFVKERNRRREVIASGKGVVPALLRRTAGFEVDWRDILPEDPVRPGDEWKADARQLMHRLSAFFHANQKSFMKVRYEEDVWHQGARCARLYVDWTFEGMRTKRLSTKIDLAGDVLFDMEGKRFRSADLAGSVVIRGALIGNGPARIVKGRGPVALKCTWAPSQVQPRDEE